MSALAVLSLVLPLPWAFAVHEAEEIMLQHRWMMAHRQRLAGRFPRLRPMLEHLSQLSTRAFAVAALEEWAVLWCATAYVLVQGPWATAVWVALFMAFSIHLVIHVLQAVAVRGYVPGLVSSLLLAPYVWYGVWSIGLVMSVVEMVLLSVAGLLVAGANLWLSHWLGIRLMGRA